MRSFPPEELYYITHIDNLQSILERGILSHERIKQLGLDYTSIYNEDVVSIRKDKSTPDRKNLWHYANLYFQPRNPMMYSVVSAKVKENLVVISISTKVMHEHGVLITDGNAANAPTQFYPRFEGLAMLKKQWDIIRNDWWIEGPGSKRKIMAECLVPENVRPDFINSIFVANDNARDSVKQTVGERQIHIIPEPHMFFEPKSKLRLTAISLLLTVICSSPRCKR